MTKTKTSHARAFKKTKRSPRIFSFGWGSGYKPRPPPGLLESPPVLRRSGDGGDMDASGSDHNPGRPNPAQETCDGSDLNICPDLVLAAFGALYAAAFLVLFTLITAASAAGRRKRKRSADLEHRPVRMGDVLMDTFWNLGTPRFEKNKQHDTRQKKTKKQMFRFPPVLNFPAFLTA